VWGDGGEVLWADEEEGWSLLLAAAWVLLAVALSAAISGTGRARTATGEFLFSMCEEHAKMLQVRHPLALPSLFLSIIVHQIGLALIEQWWRSYELLFFSLFF
jgi:hypothetical protein